MSKSTHFFGQSVFGQLIELIDPAVFSQVLRQSKADHCYKRFHSWDHLVCMLFAVFSHCTSLREVCGAMMGLKGKLEHFGLRKAPRRSTLSDSNRCRTTSLFALLYYKLFQRYRTILSDSRFMQIGGKSISVIDSTTIGLFKDILRCVGRTPVKGKRKGGIKVHTELILDEHVPRLVWFTAATVHDSKFLKQIDFKPDNIYVFDKGYIDYNFYEDLIGKNIGFVTRLKASATYKTTNSRSSSDVITGDETIELPIRKNGVVIRTISLRKVTWRDTVNNGTGEVITNIVDMGAENIPLIYRQRWQIECMYKQLKQNFPLRYFLGDNENAITIQIWCTLIANLLLSVIQSQLKRHVAFSCMASYVRVNLINYIHLIRFLNNPEKDWCDNDSQQSLPSLFSP
jgi:hypothetical protein